MNLKSLKKNNKINKNLLLSIPNNFINVKKYNLLNIYLYEKNNKKNIFHITHNLGGGIDVYIENLINIFDNYNHIIIKIIGKNYVNINNDIFEISIVSYLLYNCNSTVFIHNLLCFDNYTMINEEILNILMNNNLIKKILILHDYYLLFPNNPNIIKLYNIIPNIQDIKLSKKIINNCEKIIFNSNSCFMNYKKYISSIENSIILNNVPDIDFYNNRYFPLKKNIYKIGILGMVGKAEHKGKFLLEKILKNFENNNQYKFVLFGDCTLKDSYNNLEILGIYNNNNIFNLINEKKIDYFLFLSVYEETYSLSLSIAIKFGLPIIYNDIGVYTERLISYNNCFPFNEENFFIIKNILQYIHNNFNNSESNESSVDIYQKFNINNEVQIYKNLPELSEYLKHNDDLNLDLSSIINNLYKKNVTFINFINNDISDVSYENNFSQKIKYIQKSEVYDKLDYVFILLFGFHCKIICDHKIKVIYYSSNMIEQDIKKENIIKYFLDNIPFSINILEIDF
jgi:hypothetical protein